MQIMRDVNITITSGTVIKTIFIGFLFWALFMLRDLVLVLLTSVVFASSIEPFTQWFMKYKIPRLLAVILIYVLLIGGLAGIVYLFLPPLLNDVSDILVGLPAYVESVEIPKSFGGSVIQGNDLVDDISKKFSISDALVESRSALSTVSGGFLSSVSVIFGGFFSFILIVVLSFYLAVQEKGIEHFLRLITPIHYEKKIINLWQRSQKKIGLWMQGQLLLGLLIGILVFLGLTILGVKHALFLAVLSAFAELIPLVGPIIAATPAVLLGFTDSVQLGFMVLGFFIIIQQFENHLIYPLVVRKVVGVSPIMVILSLIIGAQLAGFLGMLLAVPLATTLLEFVDDVQKEKEEQTKRKEQDE